MNAQAPQIWKRANAVLQNGELTARSILERFRVHVLCTTDDASDDLAYRQVIAAQERTVLAYPTFRPDKTLQRICPQLSMPGQTG